MGAAVRRRRGSGGCARRFALAYLWGVNDSLYDGVIRIDGYALFFKAFFIALGGVVVLVSVDFVRRNLEHPGEYYGILLFTVVAMMLLAASGELLTAYISLELLSFGLYVLVAYDRYNPKSNEGATKYILLGAFSSALLLFGMSQDIWAAGHDSIRRDKQGARIRGRAQSRTDSRHRADSGGAWVQGRRRAVPHVGAGCLRGRADTPHGAPRGRIEGGGIRAGAAPVRGGVHAHRGAVAGAVDRPRRDNDAAQAISSLWHSAT